MNWYRWRIGRVAYAPHQTGPQYGYGFRWVKVVFGFYVGYRP